MKRTRGGRAVKKSEDEESEFEEEPSEPVVKQKKGTKAGGAKVVKKPVVFKLGKWNPDMAEIIPYDKFKEEKDNKPYTDCCTRCSNRNVHRACYTGSKALLENCLKDMKNVSSTSCPWSTDSEVIPLQILLEQNNLEMLEAFIKPKVPKGPCAPHENDWSKINNTYYNMRVMNQPYLIHKVETGMVSEKAYGVRVRKV